jgi:hypothetical protein
VLESAQDAATIVQSDAVRKPSPGKRVDFFDVVQELDQLIGGARTSFTAVVCSIASKLSRT